MDRAHELLSPIQARYAQRTAEIAVIRAQLDAEEAHMAETMNRLVDVVMRHAAHPDMPEQRESPESYGAGTAA